MAKKPENKAPEPINSVEALQQRIASMKEAQKKFSAFTQEQVDRIFFEAAMAANKQRIPLAKLAVAESGILPCEARTFLVCGLSAHAAAIVCLT